MDVIVALYDVRFQQQFLEQRDGGVDAVDDHLRETAAGPRDALFAVAAVDDQLAGQAVVHGRDREECIARTCRCLAEMVVGGIDTTIPLFQELLLEPDIIAGDYHIHWLEQWIKAQG